MSKAKKLEKDGQAAAARRTPAPGWATTRNTRGLTRSRWCLRTDAHGGLAGWYDPSIGQQLLARPDLTLLLIRKL